MASLDMDSWQSVILAEYQAIQEAETCTVHDMSDLPAGRQPVGSKCLFKVKHNANGSVERYKARIVAKSYSQIEGFDYDETFVPVMRYDFLCLIIALAAQLALDTDQLDIKSAFLNGDLFEEIWIVPPPGIGLDGQILQLDKAIYGLKQPPLAWFEKPSDALAEIGFISLPFDTWVFISADHKIIVVIYVDDITTAGSRSDINPLIDHLRSRFQATVKGSLTYILGIEIKHTPEGIEVSQYQYITNILSRFGMESCRPVSTPIDTKTCLVKASDSDPVFE